MKDFFVYILKCNDGSYYVGHTDDIERRMAEYKEGINCGSYTLSRMPVELLFQESFATREGAIIVERQLKGWSRRKKELLINSGWDALKGYQHKKT